MYKTVAIAGTFDRLHKGHRYFISQAFELGHKVIIGLTSDRYVEGKLKTNVNNYKAIKTPGRWPAGKDSFQVEELVKPKIQNFKIRKIELKEFLREEKLLERAEIVTIEDVYGPAIRRAGLQQNEIEALVVTKDTLKGGEEVNRKRKELGLRSLKLIRIPMVLAEDEERIASTRIRIGEIDRWGKAFAMQISPSTPLGTGNFQFPISNELRQELKKPLGKLIKGNPDDLNEVADELKKAVEKTNLPLISTVGDEVTKSCNEIGIAISLAIVDFKVNRIEKYHNLEELGFLLPMRHSGKPKAHPESDSGQARMTGTAMVEESVTRVMNPPGHITKELVSAVKNAYLGIIKDGKQRIIQVDGEEDLAGVPAVLLAPLGTIVLYGQPQEGVVAVEVTEDKKRELLDFIAKY